MKKSQTRDKKRKALILYAGGKCQICGYDKCDRALEFHHLNPANKRFSIASHIDRKMEMLYEEVDKCVLLCANCHREYHAGIIGHELALVRASL